MAERLVSADDTVFLNDLLDLSQPKDLRALYDAMDNETRNQGKRRTVAGLVERASRMRPRLLVVEDIHWANDLQLAHFAKLAATVAKCPALLVMTSRVEGDPLNQEWRSRTAGAPLITIDLGPLRRGGGRRYWRARSRMPLIGRSSSASSDRPAIRCSSSSCCGTPSERESGIRARCRTSCRPG